MDLLNLDTKKFAEEGAFLQFKHPATGKLLATECKGKKPIGMYIKGSDSATLRKLANKTVNEMRAKAKAQKGISDDEFDLGEVESDTAEVLAKLVTGFENLVENKIELQYSYEAAFKLFTTYPWMLEQAKEYKDDRGNFIKS